MEQNGEQELANHRATEGGNAVIRIRRGSLFSINWGEYRWRRGPVSAAVRLSRDLGTRRYKYRPRWLDEYLCRGLDWVGRGGAGRVGQACVVLLSGRGRGRDYAVLLGVYGRESEALGL